MPAPMATCAAKAPALSYSSPWRVHWPIGDHIYALISSDRGKPGWPHRRHLGAEPSLARSKSSTRCGSPISRRTACNMSKRTAPGLPVGDPIEAAALGEVYGKCTKFRGSLRDRLDQEQYWAPGSGCWHGRTDQDGAVPAASPDSQRPCTSRTPNPQIAFDDLRLRVAQRLQPWPETHGQPPRAGVNSFGFGGTNGHAILEAAPDASARRAFTSERRRRSRLDAAAFGAQRRRAFRSGAVLSDALSEERALKPAAMRCATSAFPAA